jgi:hypothetical protein
MSFIKGDSSVSRNLGVRNSSLARTPVTTSATTLTLDIFATGIQIFSGSVAGQVVNLGNATAYLSTGHLFILINKSNNSINLVNNGGTLLRTLKKNDSVIAVLEDASTTNGVWDFLSFSIESFSAPPFLMGRSGNTPSGTWLQNETVPTNIVGIPVFIDDGYIARIAIFNENVSTFTVEVYEHDGTTFTLLHSTTLTAQKSRIEQDLNIPITYGKALAAYVSSGSAKNIKVALSLRGTA